MATRTGMAVGAMGAMFMLAAVAAAEPDIVLADFEGRDYGDWKATGAAFGPGPAQGTLPGERPISGYLGNGLVNSFYGGDGATGTLTSPELTIDRRFITFLIGGGGYAGKTCMNLLVDGKVVRTATGPNTKPGGSTALAPCSWDVSEFAGKTAHIEIVDNATGGWGHITVDQIVLTDQDPTVGEVLYNGIRLPKAWPPPRYGRKDRSPLPVPPYLEHPPAVIPIDVGRQLFVDDFLIENTTLKRQFHYPDRYEGNPILKPERPVELNEGQRPLAAMISGGAWYDPKDRLFKLWYQAGWRDGTMLAVSKDGLHWERPDLDVAPGTNRVLPERPRHVRHGTGICLDQYTSDATQRFKMLIYEENDDKLTSVCTSPDGIHWDFRGLTSVCGDNSTMFYNPFRRKWVYSLRMHHWGRARNYREHDDFLQGMTWNDREDVFWAGADELDLPDPDVVALMPKPEEIRKEAQATGKKYEDLLKQYRSDYGDPTQLYNLDAVAYESLMLGVFGIHRGPNNKICERLKRPKLCDLELAYSRDGFHWYRPDRTPFLASTRKEDDWDRAYLHIAVGLCNIVGDKLYFYYSGWNGESPALGADMYAGGSAGVAFLRRDGFASMDAGEKGGTLTTRPVTFKGKYLFVNLDAPQGELRVEVLDETGNVIAPFSADNCMPVCCDKTLQGVTWKGVEDLSQLAGRKVKLRFHLRQGLLYAFWVTPDANGASYGYVAAGGPGFTGPVDTRGDGRE